MKLKILLGVLFASTIALGAAEIVGGVDYFAETRPIDFIKGIYIGNRLGASSPLKDTQNKISNSSAILFNWDFPACAGSGFATVPVTNCHNHTVSISVPAARLGDYCGVTSDHGIADGGLSDSATFDCSVIDTGLVVVREHYTATDAGVYDAPDSGYSIRTFGIGTIPR